MSIFRNTFTETVREQLNARQKALQKRNSNDIIYLNSRSSWVRMTSGVNVDGTNDLAKDYVMLGGVLNSRADKSLRSGVGTSDKAYANLSPSISSYNSNTRTAGTAGLKPMPGITSVDIKSKSAYGSLREVIVNFSCHNLQQLEDLELLYMRPGYTTLIEWGWTPFLDNKGNIKNNISFYDGVLNGNVDKETVFKDLFQKSKDHFGNYDALYGYVKNYSWTARMDGGYECQTTIISIGEILESLNANWVPLDIASAAKRGLIGLNPIYQPQTALDVASYIAKVANLSFTDNSFEGKRGQNYSKNILAGLCFELYSFCYSELEKFSYEKATSPKILKDGKSLYNLFVFEQPLKKPDNTIVKGNVHAYITLESFTQLLNDHIVIGSADSKYENKKPFIEISTKPNKYDVYAPSAETGSLLCLAHPLQVSTDPSVCLITSPIWAGGVSFNLIDESGKKSTKSLPAIPYLNQLKRLGEDFRYGNYQKDELGKIGNIYINIDRIYQLATDPNLQTKDQDLKIYDLLKAILKEVQESIGGVNTFEIHVDPQDSVARIIDVNYVDANPRSEVYKNTFQIEMANLSSTVRSYNIQSQIFPEQASLVAIGAQIGGGGSQASQNNTLLDFNNNLEDRIIPRKIASVISSGDSDTSSNTAIVTLKNNLSVSIEKIGSLLAPNKDSKPASNTTAPNQISSTDYKNALTNIIRYFQGVTKSNTKNRAIIPIKASLTMDGIGGLIIGHLFKIPPDLLPKGYKTDNTGNKLLQIVTGISHKIDKGDWTTTIDALNIIISDPKGNANFSDLITITDGNKATIDGSSGGPAIENLIPTKEEASMKNISIAIDKLKSAGYNKFATAALIGGLIQESNLDSNKVNPNGGAYGIAQWLDDRLIELRKRKDSNTLSVQLDFIVYELNNKEASAGRRLKNAQNLEDAVAGAASYERYGGINVRDGVTYEEVVVAKDTGKRIGFAKDILNRINAEEFGKY
jgi:hypothetical protein